MKWICGSRNVDAGSEYEEQTQIMILTSCCFFFNHICLTQPFSVPLSPPSLNPCFPINIIAVWSHFLL